MPLYLLDSNVLISANRNYYPLDRIPQYWDWVIEKASANQIKIPPEIYEEISKASDNLAQ